MTNPIRVLAVAAAGLFSASISQGAIRVILPVYFVSTGMDVSKIALLFVFFELSQITAPIGMAMMINRIGYRSGFVWSLCLHTVLSLIYVVQPGLWAVYMERFVRGLISVPLLAEVYIKRFSSSKDLGSRINLLLGFRDISKGVGMLIGGVLIGVMPIEYSFAVLGLMTAGAALLAIRGLPDVRETVSENPLRFWSRVNRNIKILATGQGLLKGAEEGWAVVILPVYLTTVFDLSPAVIGTVMMSLLFIQGGGIAAWSRIIDFGNRPRTRMIMCALALVPISIALAAPVTVYIFLAIAVLYYLAYSGCTLYYNYLKLEFASPETTSIDLATYKVISHTLTPVAILISGFIAEYVDVTWAFYFAGLLAFFSAMTCLALPRSASSANWSAEPAE